MADVTPVYGNITAMSHGSLLALQAAGMISVRTSQRGRRDKEAHDIWAQRCRKSTFSASTFSFKIEVFGANFKQNLKILSIAESLKTGRITKIHPFTSL